MAYDYDEFLDEVAEETFDYAVKEVLDHFDIELSDYQEIRVRKDVIGKLRDNIKDVISDADNTFGEWKYSNRK